MLVTNRGRTKINPLVQNVSWYSWGGGVKWKLKLTKCRRILITL